MRHETAMDRIYGRNFGRRAMRARVTFEGELRHTSRGRFLIADSGEAVPVRDGGGADVEILPDPVPAWKPGDVVVVRFHPRGEPYTYVRGMRSWPGESARGKTDADMDDLFREGKVEPVLQRGGEPFDERRLP